MRHDFSAHFLRVVPPETSFGQAWESLCFDLLYAEYADPSLLPLNPPDRGIDILHRSEQTAYQCKSTEDGAFGSIPANESIRSLHTACTIRSTFNWTTYRFATNADYTGSAIEKILSQATALGLSDSQIEFRGPKYWDELCTRHYDHVKHRFDYRASISEKQVIEAFRSANYFEKYINRFAEHISNSKFSIIIMNNRTPLEIEVPFSPELSVENCLDMTQELLGISLKWTNFADLGTSAGPSLSLTVDRVSQGFSQKIKDLPIKGDGDLQLWIKIVWKDEGDHQGRDSTKVYNMLSLYTPRELARDQLTYEQRRQETIHRTEDLIQAMIWKSARRLKEESTQSHSI